MKTEVRRKLARLSFEEKIRKVEELIRLSRTIKNQGVGSKKEKLRTFETLKS